MNDPQVEAARFAEVFEEIHRKQMADIPILNPALTVEAVEFQHLQEKIIGIVITPWLMMLVLLPTQDEDWSDLEIGKKMPHRFPSQTYKLVVNEIEGIGKFQSHSLYSPMNEFLNQAHALAAAKSFMTTLLTDKQSTKNNPVDENLLGQILRGEETPDLQFDDSNGTFTEVTDAGIPESDSQSDLQKKISRRELLRARFLGND